jgi:hypothetical protein
MLHVPAASLGFGVDESALRFESVAFVCLLISAHAGVGKHQGPQTIRFFSHRFSCSGQGLTGHISPVASKIHDVSAVARSSNQVGGA